jgi:hypothetical protein
MSTATTTVALVPQKTENANPVRFWHDPIEFATQLVSLTGPQFMAFDAEYDMDAKGKMLVKHRVTKEPNPYVGRGLTKVATTQVTVNFDYEAKVEAREGIMSGKGNWTQAVTINGKPTCLSTHKDDCTVGADGAITFHENPRLYLRCEIVRVGEGESRAEKKMRSESHYELREGNTVTVVSEDDLDPYLPSRAPRHDETDFIVVTLSNIVELRAGGYRWRQWKGENAVNALNAAIKG